MFHYRGYHVLPASLLQGHVLDGHVRHILLQDEPARVHRCEWHFVAHKLARADEWKRAPDRGPNRAHSRRASRCDQCFPDFVSGASDSEFALLDACVLLLLQWSHAGQPV